MGATPSKPQTPAYVSKHVCHLISHSTTGLAAARVLWVRLKEDNRSNLFELKPRLKMMMPTTKKGSVPYLTSLIVTPWSVCATAQRGPGLEMCVVHAARHQDSLTMNASLHHHPARRSSHILSPSRSILLHLARMHCAAPRRGILKIIHRQLAFHPSMHTGRTYGFWHHKWPRLLIEAGSASYGNRTHGTWQRFS